MGWVDKGESALDHAKRHWDNAGVRDIEVREGERKGARRQGGSREGGKARAHSLTL